MNRLLLFWCSVCLLIGSYGSGREKRQLLFPQQSIMQLAFAVVTPAQVKNRLITTNMGVMFNIDLPTNISRWYPWRPDYRRKRTADAHADSDRALYSLMQAVMSINGLDGRACLQKSFCQLQETPVHGDSTPIRILNIMFRLLKMLSPFATPHFQGNKKRNQMVQTRGLYDVPNRKYSHLNRSQIRRPGTTIPPATKLTRRVISLSSTCLYISLPLHGLEANKSWYFEQNIRVTWHFLPNSE